MIYMLVHTDDGRTFYLRNPTCTDNYLTGRVVDVEADPLSSPSGADVFNIMLKLESVISKKQVYFNTQTQRLEPRFLSIV